MLAQHPTENNHDKKCEEAKIMDVERHLYERKFLEATRRKQVFLVDSVSCSHTSLIISM